MLAKVDAFESRLVQLAEYAKALAHPARLAILELLAEYETCICGDLVEKLPLAQASVSRHLKALKEAGLIKGEVEGPRSCYCLNKAVLAEVESGLGIFFTKLRETPLCDECC